MPDIIDAATVPLDDVCADLAAEQAVLDDLLAGCAPDDHARLTPAEGWTVSHQVAHLAQGEELAALALSDPDAFGAELQRLLSDLDATASAFEREAADAAPQALHARWKAARDRVHEGLRGLDARDKVPWVVGPMAAASFARARLMEAWAHGLDVADALAVGRPEDDQRLRHLCYLGIRTRAFSHQIRDLETPPETLIRVELDSLAGERWTWGPADAPQRIAGPAWDFAAVVTQRRHRADTRLEIRGDEADRWMSIAQAFAGPPTDGRRPGTFAPRPR